MTFKKSILILMISSLSLLLNFNCLFLGTEQSLPYTCTTEDRTKDCSDATQRTVCGWFSSKIQCFRYPCAITTKSICEACTSENVETVTDNDCEKQDDKPVSNDNPDNETPNESDVFYCTTDQRKEDLMCTEEWLPVCGYNKNQDCKTSDCYKEYGNNCNACKNSDIVYTIKGECKVYKETESNTSTEEIRYTITGEVDTNNNYPELYFCTEEDQSKEACTAVNEDTCGFSNCDDEDGCFIDYSSKCAACKNKDIVYSTNGKCKDIETESVRLYYLAVTTKVVDDKNSSGAGYILNIGMISLFLLLSSLL